MEYKKKSAVIIGAGPAGCMCAFFASKNYDVTLFDFSTPLHTLLCTGGGRCNLAFAEYDFKELAKFYPRGEKFLYSVFSQFSTADTIEFFEKIGVETYVQDDLRIFPKSNSAKDVREKMLNTLKNCNFKKEKVVDIIKNDKNFSIVTDKNTYSFDKIVIATGGHAEHVGFSLAKNLGHKIVEPKPALTGLISKENLKMLQGVSLKNIKAEMHLPGNVMLNSFQHRKSKRLCDPETSSGRRRVISIQGDMIFTHEGISGPLVYKISSICARENYSANNPLIIKLNLISNPNLFPFPISLFPLNDLQGMLNANPKKSIKNLIAEFVPKSLAEYILEMNKIGLDQKCCDINGKTRDLILKQLQEFEINIISPAKEGEVVTSGGICLDEINPKTMESKIIHGLYFCGEIIDADGFCGGFNLQNCWSTGYVAGKSNE